jgi:hypothetical protein
LRLNLLILQHDKLFGREIETKEGSNLPSQAKGSREGKCYEHAGEFKER